MTPNEIRAQITSRFLAVAGPLVGDQLQTDDQQFDPDTQKAWMRLTVLFNGGGILTLGGEDVCRKRQRTGVATINVFTVLDSGTAVADNDAWCDLFLKAFDGIYADSPTRYGQPTDVRISTAGRDDAWWLQSVIVPFTSEYTS